MAAKWQDEAFKEWNADTILQPNKGGNADFRPLHKVCKGRFLVHRNGGHGMKKSAAVQTPCEACANYRYDEEYGYYICEAALDEDEMVRFLSGTCSACPYYQMDDEYKIVRKQM